MSVNPVKAKVDGDVIFSWQPNPPGDDVNGYRLYYGAYSRFDPSGTLKANFSYDYYIDFTGSQRCIASSNGTSCEVLRADELQCENLYTGFPKCTLFGLRGYLYFALTAYNVQAESGFTPELSMTVNPPQGPVVLQQVTALLLLKKK